MRSKKSFTYMSRVWSPSLRPDTIALGVFGVKYTLAPPSRLYHHWSTSGSGDDTLISTLFLVIVAPSWGLTRNIVGATPSSSTLSVSGRLSPPVEMPSAYGNNVSPKPSKS